MGARGIQTEINQAEVQWARENLQGIPSQDDGLYDRMISGMDYNAMAPDYVKLRIIRHEKVCEFNELRLASHTGRPLDSTTDADVESFLKERDSRIRQIFGKVGKNPFVEPPLSVDYGFNISVGDNFYANFNLVVLDGAIVRIGNNVMIGPNVTISTATHPVESTKRDSGDEYAESINIEDSAWIGASATILPGVTLGEGCVVAAGATVAKDVAPHTIVGGVPAKFIRYTDIKHQAA